MATLAITAIIIIIAIIKHIVVTIITTIILSLVMSDPVSQDSLTSSRCLRRRQPLELLAGLEGRL